MSNNFLNTQLPKPRSSNLEDNLWPREYLYSILKAALSVKEYRFVRQTALYWLASYPGDLPVDLIHGQALLGEGHIQQAQRVAEKLCERDPEFLGAQILLDETQNKPGLGKDFVAHGVIQALGENPDPKATSPKGHDLNPEWVQPLREARKALQAKDFPRAEENIQEALKGDPDTPIAALTHLQILYSQPDTPRSAIQNLAQHFHLRWPECVPFMLLLADSLMDIGHPDQAVALLHQAAAYDITGQVIERLWGENHPYRNLWPNRLTAVIDIPIPARVAAVLGWNLLEANTSIYAELPEIETLSTDETQPEAPEDIISSNNKATQPKNEEQLEESAPPPWDPPETLRSVQAELKRVGDRLQKPGLARSDGRFPTYVILTTKRGLQQKYGRAGAAMLDAGMQELAEIIRRQRDWGALVFYADDPGCAAELSVKPAQADDAWALKLALADLDKALGKQGAMIGALLIVGGPDVVPFHSLPNPTDDPDTEVPSDNPYASRDGNYFIPEWPVGRLPGEADANPVQLLGTLQAITTYHATSDKLSHRWWDQLWLWIQGLMRISKKNGSVNFGYSAEVWRKASLAVYQQIGSPRELITSPPIDIQGSSRQSDLHLHGKLGYFNLHGLPDTGEWYGQSDPSNGSQEFDYPVALRTQDVVNGGRSPEIIFSEACYGTYILGKTIENSLALKFLASGSRAVVGSTVMSYGSISTPLNAADLLGVAFWKFLKEGFPTGEALRRAKIHLAREMHKRQGYLDGEDQKTLISFVLYGDPLAQPTHQSQYRSKTVIRAINPPPQVKTVCDRSDSQDEPEPIPEDVMVNVKRVVAQYLPGMQGAQVTLSHEHADCDCKGHNCPTGQLGPKARPAVQPDRRVVTLSKSIPVEKQTHQTYARLTLDKTGKVVKVAVSR